LETILKKKYEAFNCIEDFTLGFAILILLHSKKCLKLPQSNSSETNTVVRIKDFAIVKFKEYFTNINDENCFAKNLDSMVHAYENLIKEIQNDLKYLPQILNINLDNEVFTKKVRKYKRISIRYKKLDFKK
jgi:enolase